MVVISASLPMVKELVTDFPGVLEVTTKSLPFCLISVIGLMSLATLMMSSGSSVEQNTDYLVISCTELTFFNQDKSYQVLFFMPRSPLLTFLTHDPEELLVVLLRVDLPCSTVVHVFQKVGDLLYKGGLEAETAVRSSTQCGERDRLPTPSYIQRQRSATAVSNE